MIFFDLDGTLHRTHETCLPPLRELCAELGINITKDDEDYMLYATGDSFLARVAPDMSAEQRAQFRAELSRREHIEIRKRGRLFDGVEDMLRSLHSDGIPMAICSMSSKQGVDAEVDRCGIRPYFSAILHRVEGKTKSQVLAGFLAEQDLSPGECIMVGDSATDLMAAKDNGMPFIGVSYGYGAKDIQAEVLVDNAGDLLSEIYRALTYSCIEKNLTNLNSPVVVGINGVDTAGKTVYASGLARYFELRGFHTQLVNLDDFHNPLAVRRQDNTPEGYIKYAFDLPRLEFVLKELKSGKGGFKLDLLDIDSDTYTKRTSFKADKDTIIIVEGVHLYRPQIESLIDYKVFLDIDFDEIMHRASIRDVPKYGEEFLLKYTERYIPAQRIYLDEYKPKERSDLIIDNNNFSRPVIR